MLTFTISKQDKILSGEITLCPSKSISNRDIVIRALRNAKHEVKPLPEKDTNKIFDELLRDGKIPLDKGEPAKAIRFLRAFLSYFKGEWIITGSAEMRKRPVGDVIEILQSEGINIKFIEREGYPPLKIIGKGMRGSITRVDAIICSQFINAALLIASTVPTDDVIDLKNRIISSPYIDQTLRLLRYLGVNNYWNREEVLIEHELHTESDMTIEVDWLSASYWYELAALADKAEFKINGLNPDSVQCNAIVKELFEPLGVKTESTGLGVIITKTARKLSSFEYNFSNSPQLVPTMVATCVALNIPFTFQGMEVVRSKDPDRIMALQSQLGKLGAKLNVIKKGEFESLTFDGKANIPNDFIEFSVYNDHRVSMSLVPLSIMGCKVRVDNPRVVSKSYPTYWNDFKKAGFKIE
jgi:3-phosphoshikimate 1-carboxyvinyltransferase